MIDLYLSMYKTKLTRREDYKELPFPVILSFRQLQSISIYYSYCPLHLVHFIYCSIQKKQESNISLQNAKMVSLRNIVAAIALSVPVIAQTTPSQVVDNIRMITQKSQALQGPAQSITLINGPLLLVGLGPFPVSDPFF